jgi:enoyl-CoA hydratase/carnithine racemase
MSYQTILCDVSDGIARLTLNRPDRLNSFNVEMHGEVRDALSKLAEDRAARVLVLTGAGRGFCAGQDLGDRAVAPGGQGVDLGDSIDKYYKPLVLALRNLPMPVIAAVNGVAAGAGANIALSCDLVIATRSASFIQSFSKLGLVPDSDRGYARTTAGTCADARSRADQAGDLRVMGQVVRPAARSGARLPARARPLARLRGRRRCVHRKAQPEVHRPLVPALP